jgi:plastocyanin
MDFLKRPIAAGVLGLLVVFLLITIGLQFAPVPATPTPAPQAAQAAPPKAPTAASGGGSGATINATEKDFAIALDNSSVAAGSVTFKITNQGPSPHNISIKEMKKTSDTIDGGKTGQLTVDLPAGAYTVICDISGHEQLGMSTKITVK